MDDTFLNFVVEPQVRKYCGPLFFVNSTFDGRTVKGSATFALVDTGTIKLMVTCWHVIHGKDGFLHEHSKNPDIRFGIGIGGKHPVSITREQLFAMRADEEERCDLFAFKVGDSESLQLIAASNLEFYNLKANRPPNVHVGNVLYLIGFPGKGRIENATSVGHVRQPIGVEVSEVGTNTFMARLTDNKLTATDFGGISGAPCFIVNEAKPIRLVGFCMGFGDVLNTLLFTYARYLGEDGLIRYMT